LANKTYIIFILIVFSGCYNKPEAIDTEVVTDRDYYPVFHNLVDNSRESIYFVMYISKLSQNNETYYLFQDLVNARGRGVEIKILLDSSSYDNDLNTANTAFAESLGRYNIEVRFDAPNKTTHAKFGIFDHRKSLIGSTNWTMSALERNHEANILIDSREIATQLEEYFFSIWEEK